MDPISAVLVSATVVDMVKKVWELKFLIDGDPANEKTYRCTSNYDFRKSSERQFLITTRGGRLVKVQPVGGGDDSEIVDISELRTRLDNSA